MENPCSHRPISQFDRHHPKAPPITRVGPGPTAATGGQRPSDQPEPHSLRHDGVRPNVAPPEGLPGGVVAAQQDPRVRDPGPGPASRAPPLAQDGPSVQNSGQYLGAVPGDEATVRADAEDGARAGGAAEGGAGGGEVGGDGGRRHGGVRGERGGRAGGAGS